MFPNKKRADDDDDDGKHIAFVEVSYTNVLVSPSQLPIKLVLLCPSYSWVKTEVSFIQVVPATARLQGQAVRSWIYALTYTTLFYNSAIQ